MSGRCSGLLRWPGCIDGAMSGASVSSTMASAGSSAATLRRRGQPQLGLEQRLLGVAVEVFQVVVQADLADRAELRLAAQALQPLAQVVQVLRAVPRQVDGVQAERRVQAILGLRQVPDPLPVLAVDAEHHLALDPQRAAALQQRGAVGVEVREVEVVVGVDQAHGGRLSRAA